MFGPEQFQQLYQMLDPDMVDSDCGIRCGKFCCIGDGQTDNAFKYLLPGEAEYLVGHNYHHHAVLEDFGFLIHYHSIEPGVCACQNVRNYRPFCCRMFPFRPLIDQSRTTVVDLTKTRNELFSPCWVEQPLSPWRARAIDAWNFLFTDRIYLQFYARYYLCLKKSETSSASFARAMAEDEDFRLSIIGLDSLSVEQLWRLCAMFFAYV
jgi:hypothetical protein